MDFFGHQDIARRKTGVLHAIFMVSIAVYVLTLYLVGMGVVWIVWAVDRSKGGGGEFPLFNWIALVSSVAVSAIFIGGGAWYKHRQLRGGGRVVAERLGGELLLHGAAGENALAAAVQYTRNPQAVVDALRVIGAHNGGARLRSPNVSEASHIFFASATGQDVMSRGHTHPPLRDRIYRIDPDWDGQYLKTEATAEERAELDARWKHIRSKLGVTTDASEAHGPEWKRASTMADAIRGAVEIVPSGLVALAVLERIPDPIRKASRDPFEARAVILGLLMSADEETHGPQLAWLGREDAALGAELRSLLPEVIGLPRDIRLTVLEQAMQPLAALSPEQAARFGGIVDSFIRADSRVSLFEWVLQTLVRKRLDAAMGVAIRTPVKYYAITRLTGDVSVLLSAVAYAGAGSEDAAREAFLAGTVELQGHELVMVPREQTRLRGLSESLGVLASVSKHPKEALLRACGAVITHDGRTTPAEAELFRAIAASLGMPVPPLV